MHANPHPTLPELLQLVRTYTNGHSEAGPYDVNGVIHLVLAALDNLRQHWVDADLEQFSASTSPEQRTLLVLIGRYLDQTASPLHDEAV